MTTPAEGPDTGEQQTGNDASGLMASNPLISATPGAHIDLEPTAVDASHSRATVSAPETDGETKVSSPARSKSGWDGKLRVGSAAQANGEHAESNEDSSDEEEQEQEQGNRPKVLQEQEIVEGEQIEADEDLLAEYDDDAEEIDLVHCRVRDLSNLDLGRFRKVQRLCLRQNAINEIELPSSLALNMTGLDFYDNVISHIRGLDEFTQLESLDLSFNKIKHIKRLGHLTKLKDLYFVQNKISKIEGLDGLTNLRNLELGGNRVRTIENLEAITSLEELWLGKNKLTEITGLSTLCNLKILSIQSNRLRDITGLDQLTSLEELHISHNAITSLSGLASNTNLRVIDISANPIEKLEGLETLTKLEELWASYCKFDSFQDVEKQLRDKENLLTVYFEGTPLQLRQPALYRNKVKLALPQISQIDATFVKVM